MTKPMNIRLQDSDGKVYRWSIIRVPRAVNCTVGKTRIISGWQFADHDGVERFVEGSWLDLVPQFKLVAGNYDFTLMSDLS